MSGQREVRVPERLIRAPEFIEACRTHDFATVFTLLKKRAGIYPAQIARLCELTPSRVGEIMDARRQLAQVHVIERIADGLRIPGGMLRLAARSWEAVESSNVPLSIDSSTASTEAGIPRPALDDDALALRRQLDSSRSADPALAEIFAGQVDMIRRLDRRLGAEPLLPQLRGQIGQMEGLLRHTTAPGGRQPIAEILTQAATLAGWQALDLGRYRESWQLHENAKSAAQQSGSAALLAHATAQQAYVLLDLGMPDAAVQQVQHARVLAAGRIPPLLQSWLHAAEAEAQAAAGNGDACRRALDSAERTRPTDPADPSLPFLFLAGAHLDRWRGNCLATLGADEALRDLTRALGEMEGFNRAEAGVRCDLAVVLLRRGEIDEARRQALRAQELATDTHSLRQRRRIEQVLQQV
ncbi:helix-turn-helix domain-containing protein [Streptomyces sp. NPDC056056]|uniref:helix-turn-helix domain-containing protein n=1 Tax=Streptomyces sp. NPDC056056 TaxID=3345698 RepID=UPI0035D6E9D8